MATGIGNGNNPGINFQQFQQLEDVSTLIEKGKDTAREAGGEAAEAEFMRDLETAFNAIAQDGFLSAQDIQRFAGGGRDGFAIDRDDTIDGQQTLQDLFATPSADGGVTLQKQGRLTNLLNRAFMKAYQSDEIGGDRHITHSVTIPTSTEAQGIVNGLLQNPELTPGETVPIGDENRPTIPVLIDGSQIPVNAEVTSIGLNDDGSFNLAIEIPGAEGEETQVFEINGNVQTESKELEELSFNPETQGFIDILANTTDATIDPQLYTNRHIEINGEEVAIQSMEWIAEENRWEISAQSVSNPQGVNSYTFSVASQAIAFEPVSIEENSDVYSLLQDHIQDGTLEELAGQKISVAMPPDGEAIEMEITTVIQTATGTYAVNMSAVDQETHPGLTAGMEVSHAGRTLTENTEFLELSALTNRLANGEEIPAGTIVQVQDGGQTIYVDAQSVSLNTDTTPPSLNITGKNYETGADIEASIPTALTTPTDGKQTFTQEALTLALNNGEISPRDLIGCVVTTADGPIYIQDVHQQTSDTGVITHELIGTMQAADGTIQGATITQEVAEARMMEVGSYEAIDYQSFILDLMAGAYGNSSPLDIPDNLVITHGGQEIIVDQILIEGGAQAAAAAMGLDAGTEIAKSFQIIGREVIGGEDYILNQPSHPAFEQPNITATGSHSASVDSLTEEADVQATIEALFLNADLEPPLDTDGDGSFTAQEFSDFVNNHWLANRDEWLGNPQNQIATQALFAHFQGHVDGADSLMNFARVGDKTGTVNNPLVSTIPMEQAQSAATLEVNPGPGEMVHLSAIGGDFHTNKPGRHYGNWDGDSVYRSPQATVSFTTSDPAGAEVSFNFEMGPLGDNQPSAAIAPEDLVITYQGREISAQSTGADAAIFQNVLSSITITNSYGDADSSITSYGIQVNNSGPISITAQAGTEDLDYYPGDIVPERDSATGEETGEYILTNIRWDDPTVHMQHVDDQIFTASVISTVPQPTVQRSGTATFTGAQLASTPIAPRASLAQGNPPLSASVTPQQATGTVTGQQEISTVTMDTIQVAETGIKIGQILLILAGIALAVGAVVAIVSAIRGSGESKKEDTIDTEDTEDTIDADTEDTIETQDTIDTEDTIETQDTVETEDTIDTEDTQDTIDTDDTSDASDTDDTSDTSDTGGFTTGGDGGSGGDTTAAGTAGGEDTSGSGGSGGFTTGGDGGSGGDTTAGGTAGGEDTSGSGGSAGFTTGGDGGSGGDATAGGEGTSGSGGSGGFTSGGGGGSGGTSNATETVTTDTATEPGTDEVLIGGTTPETNTDTDTTGSGGGGFTSGGSGGSGGFTSGGGGGSGGGKGPNASNTGVNIRGGNTSRRTSNPGRPGGLPF